MSVLAVDLGGTKVAVALVTSKGKILEKAQQPTDLSGPEAVAVQIAQMAHGMPEHELIEAVGACVPAALADRDADRVIWAPNLPGWRDVPFRELLEKRFQVPVFLEFDGHSATLGEWWVGAGKGYSHVANIIIGTGIGGGFIVDGKLWLGRNRLAGAVGWFPLAGPDGVDHWENLASGPAIVRRVKYLLAESQASRLNVDAMTAKDVFSAARQGDALATQVIQEAAKTIGEGVANVISLINPEIVILGGSIGQQGNLLLKTVRETVMHWAQPISASDVPIVSSTLGEQAGLLGAAYAAYQRLSS
jgi:glucokinase